MSFNGDDKTNGLHQGTCIECNEDKRFLDTVLYEHFDLLVCVTCKLNRNMENGCYQLISKSKAKKEYSVPESFFNGIPYQSKPNPRHESFAPLKLYLKKTVMEEAIRLYGDLSSIEIEKASRKRKLYERAVLRTRNVLKRKSILDNAILDGKYPDVTTHKKPPIRNDDHQHQFKIERYDAEASLWVKECTCGIKVQFEKW